MDVRNCKQCGKIYMYRGTSLCPNCVKEQEEIYKKVREYLYRNPGANIVVVSEETGVDEKIILQFLREGKLELREPGLGLECERCSAPITTGRMCKKCLTEFESGMKEGLAKEQDPKSTRSSYQSQMYTYNRIRKD